MKTILPFLSDLAANNNRDWFLANRKNYEIARKEQLGFIERAIVDMSAIDPSLRNLEPKKCTFRINRDIRFSPNKQPYKTNFGSFLATGGLKSLLPGYYVHLEPGNCFISCGVYTPPAESLKAIRTEILHNADELVEIFANPASQKYFTDFYPEEMLKTVPRGFPKDFEHADWLKHKHYFVFYPFADTEVEKPEFYDFVIDVWTSMKPLSDFLRMALEVDEN
jgi:uncharacterized protein (TIGR02453 family)